VRRLLVPAALLLLGGSIAGAAPTAAPSPAFAKAKRYGTGASPTSVAVGDVTGDGKLDVVSANSGAGTVSVLANGGSGTLVPKRDYASGHTPGSVAVGDLNGDARPDIVVVSSPNTVSVLLNAGAGSFEPRRNYGTGDEPDVVAIGDLNRDGRPDLATANGETNTVSVLLNRGDGSFQARVAYGTGLLPTSIGISDLNGDGAADLAVANLGDLDGSSVSIFLNRGDGSFGARQDFQTGDGPVSVAIGDLNGDGHPDLATADSEGNRPMGVGIYVSVLLNNGVGSFGPRHDYVVGDYPRQVAIGDIDGDTKPDLVTATYGGGTFNDWQAVSVLLNEGNATFGRPFVYPVRLVNEDIEDAGLAVGDLNGDGRPDVVDVESGLNAVSVLRNAPGLCDVPDVRFAKLRIAKRALKRANCRVGKIRWAKARSPVAQPRGTVLSQKPRFGAVLGRRGKVGLVVSRGRKG
jgi:hypothetical protein